jgi:uncharacterized protein (DUF433 family)
MFTRVSLVGGDVMPTMTTIDRITSTPGVCGGRPCIRGMRIRVSDILDMLADGVGQHEILNDFPDLEVDDIQACLRFAARRVDVPRVAA